MGWSCTVRSVAPNEVELEGVAPSMVTVSG